MSATATPDSAPLRLSEVVPSAGRLSGSQVIRRVFRMAILLVAARQLGVESFGAYALLLTVVEMVAIVSGYGYTDFLTREIAKDPTAGWTLASRITQLRLLYITPSLGFALLGLRAFGFPPGTLVYTALLAITLVPRAAGESVQGLLKGLRSFAPFPWIELVQGTVVLAVMTILLFLRFRLSMSGVILAEVLGATAGSAVAVWSVREQRHRRVTAAPRLKNLARATAAFNLYPFIVNVYDRVDVVLLSRLAGNFATGIYSLPYRVFTTPQIIPYGIMGSLLPALSAAKGDEAPRQTCAQAMKILYVMALVLVLATLAFARPVVHVVLGDAYARSTSVIKILVWATVPAFLNNALNTMLLARGLERVFLWTSALCTVFNVSANLLLIPRFSFYAAAGITVATELLLFGQNCYISKKYFGRPLLPIDGATCSIVFLAALAGMQLLERRVTDYWAGAAAFVVFSVFAISTLNGFNRFKAVLVRREGRLMS